VHELAAKTFLTDWSFPRPKLPNGNELSDLLIVFGDTAIIWQIKDLKLNKDGRYKRAEVERNLRQLSGARRQLFDLKTPIELENSRRRKEAFDPRSIRSVFLISVLMGEGEDIFPFVGKRGEHTVHVFTRDFTQIIFNELDTIGDFVHYLKAKEDFIRNREKFLVVMGGEQELLALYLMNGRSFDSFGDANHIVVQKGSWKHLQSRPEYKAKKRADKISYAWDGIINRAHEGGGEYERVARELARPNRFERRNLSKIFYDAHVQAHNNRSHDLFRRLLPTDGISYCFLFSDDPEPRKRRKSMLQAICWIARGKFPKNKKVLGIATEMRIREVCSYDFCLMEIPRWTKKDQKQMEELQHRTRIFVAPRVGHFQEDEYPIAKPNEPGTPPKESTE